MGVFLRRCSMMVTKIGRTVWDKATSITFTDHSFAAVENVDTHWNIHLSKKFQNHQLSEAWSSSSIISPLWLWPSSNIQKVHFCCTYRRNDAWIFKCCQTLKSNKMGKVLMRIYDHFYFFLAAKPDMFFILAFATCLKNRIIHRKSRSPREKSFSPRKLLRGGGGLRRGGWGG